MKQYTPTVGNNTKIHIMKAIFILSGLFITLGLIGQGSEMLEFQLDLGGNYLFPYAKKSVTIGPDDAYSDSKFQPSFGYFFELMSQLNFKNNLSLQTGLNFNYSKVNNTNIIDAFEGKGYIKTSYLHLPILLRYQVSDKIPLSVSGGPYFGFIINSMEKGRNSLGLYYVDYNNNIKEKCANFDFGLSTQLDYTFVHINKISGLVLLRVNFGLVDFINEQISIQLNNSDRNWKNFGIMFGFGIKV